MRTPLQQAGVRRLFVAAGLSIALHAAVAVSVQRGSVGGVSSLPTDAAPPLIARLASTASIVSDRVLPVAVPEDTVVTPEIPNQARPAATVATVHAANGAASNAGTLHYFKTSELDRRPFPLARIDVPTPDSTDIETGSVLIRLRISERGRVEDAKIVTSTGFSEFETAALREFSRAHFYPGYRDNLPVRSEMLIEVTLRPPGREQKGQLQPAQDK